MSGDWIAHVARQLIREYTYDRTVSPAIADLQFEAPGRSQRQRLLAYVSIARAFVGAVCIDIVEDLSRSFDHEARLSAWRAAAMLWVIAVGFTVIFNWRPVLGFEDLGLDGLAIVFAFSFPSIAVAALPATLVAFAVVMRRRQTEVRSILTAAAVVSLVFVVASVTLAVPAERRADQYRQAAFWRARMDTANPPRSLEAIRRDLTVELTRQGQRRARADNNRFLLHTIAAKAMGTFAFALIGIGLARKRGWRMLLWFAGAYIVWVAILAGAVGALEWAWFPRPRPSAVFPWAQTIALFVVGVLANAYLNTRSSFVIGSK